MWILIAHEIDCESCFVYHNPLTKLTILKCTQNILKVRYVRMFPQLQLSCEVHQGDIILYTMEGHLVEVKLVLKVLNHCMCFEFIQWNKEK